MNTPRHKRNGRRGAFTMIELLAVIGIIAILAALILGIAGLAWNKVRPARVGAERDAIISAIQRYKQDKGFYPPAGPGNTVTNPLFYELTGMVATLDATGSPISFTSPVTGETFSVANLMALFNINGFVNSSADKTQVKNYFEKTALTGRTYAFSAVPPATAPATTYTLFGVAVKGPQEISPVSGGLVSPWNYVSTNPTNNPDSYDLWMDITYGGGTNRANRISNWSKDPQPQ